MAVRATKRRGNDVKDQDGNVLYHEDDFVVSSSSFGKKPSPEHEAILARVRRRQIELALKRSAERRRKWGLPELGYRPPAA